MENATKALLIAGAVLLVIMIISVGLMIFNSANGQISSAISSMNQQEKDQFNQKFLGYEGNQISGSTVKTLISSVITHNRQMSLEGTEEKKVGMSISVDGDASGSNTAFDNLEANLETKRQAIVSAAKYKVTCQIDSNTGLISKILVSRNKSL